MGRNSLNILRTISFLLLVVGVILLVKNIDLFIFKNEYDLIKFIGSIGIIALAIAGYKKSKVQKKVTL